MFANVDFFKKVRIILNFSYIYAKQTTKYRKFYYNNNTKINTKQMISTLVPLLGWQQKQTASLLPALYPKLDIV